MKPMKTVRPLLLLLLLCSAAPAEEVVISTRPIYETELFDEVKAKEEIVARIQAGIYDKQTIDLCTDDAKKCEADVFEPYKKERDGKTVYSVELSKEGWSELPDEVKQAVIGEILRDTWGDSAAKYPPLEVTIRGGGSPLDRLSPYARDMYLRFGRPECNSGGLGASAYGPNCWYNAIAAVAGGDSPFVRANELTTSEWNKHRYMGPIEFRFHLNNFEEVEKPEFGDVVRYYTDDEIFWGPIGNGEIHGAVYIGREEHTDADGKKATRDICLTKNGRDDLGFLQFQDIRGIDEVYLDKLPEDSELLKKCGGKDPRKRGFFRVKKGAKLLDAAVAGSTAETYAAYLIDNVNYKERQDCLAGRIPPPPGKDASAYTYPLRWLTLKYAE